MTAPVQRPCTCDAPAGPHQLACARVWGAEAVTPLDYARGAYLAAVARQVDAEIAEALHDRRDYSPEAEARHEALSLARSAAIADFDAAALALREAIRAAGGRP